MEPLLERLQRGEVIVGDGGLGTQLIERGLQPGDCPEQWNLERPGDLTEIAAAYQAAGAEILTSNSFGGSPLKLRGYSLDRRAGEINRTAVAVLAEAAQGRAYLAGSVGPCGGILAPYGDLDERHVAESFESQIGFLAEAGSDLILIETMSDLREAELAVAAARAAAPDLPVAACMTFDRTPRGFFTIMGNSVEQATSALERAGADLIGSNCGNGIEAMLEIAGELRERTALPLVIQANAGLPENRAGVVVYPETPEFMAERTGRLIETGVAVIGGCCGTTPDHIRAIRQRVEQAG